MFFPLSPGRLVPVYSAASFALSAFHYYYFLYSVSKNSLEFREKALPTTVTQACPAV